MMEDVDVVADEFVVPDDDCSDGEESSSMSDKVSSEVFVVEQITEESAFDFDLTETS